MPWTTFWVRVVPEDADGVARSRFDGLDDNGNSYDVNLEGFDVALNGVSLVPVTDYQIDQTALILSEPAEPGDVVIIRSLKPSEGVAGGEVTTATVMLIGDDTSQPAPQAYKDWLTRNNLQTQQDANWHLLHKIEDLDIPDEFDPTGLVTEDELAEAIDPLASREWVVEQGYITEQPLNDAIDEVVQNQLETDQAQDHEIKLLEARVSQIESVSLDARYMFEGDGSLPRAGEFTILKGGEVAESWAEANGLTFNEEALEGKPEWDKVSVGDVIRLGGSTSSGIGPAANAREADSFAEFKVSAIVGSSTFTVELIRSASQPIPGVEYGVLLLSSFDPSGLATTEFVIEVSGQTLDASKQYTDNKLVGYIPKTGGDVTGELIAKAQFTAENGVLLAGGEGKQSIIAKQGFAGQLVYQNTGTLSSDQRLGWGSNTVWIYKPLNMQGNKIIRCGDADMDADADVVNVKTLKEQIDGIEVDVDKQYVDDQDGVTLDAAKKYTDDSLGTLPEVSEPDVDKAYVDAELAKKIGDTGDQILPTSNWKIRARKTADDGNYSYIDIKNDRLHLYHVADPSQDEHVLSLGYADGRYQIAQEPLVIKTTGSMECSISNSPGSKMFCGLYNSSPGSSTNANEWFGNWNAGMRVNIDGMKTPDGAEFAQGQKYIFNGYVTVVGYDNGKVYFKHAVNMIHRSGSDSYVYINFSSRVATYATGKYDASDRYVVTIEGYINKPVTTLNTPDGGDE